MQTVAARTERHGLMAWEHASRKRLPNDTIRLLVEAVRDEPQQPDDSTNAGASLFNRLSRWLTHQQQMSNSSLILAFEQRRQLGLPEGL